MQFCNYNFQVPNLTPLAKGRAQDRRRLHECRETQFFSCLAQMGQSIWAEDLPQNIQQITRYPPVSKKGKKVVRSSLGRSSNTKGWPKGQNCFRWQTVWASRAWGTVCTAHSTYQESHVTFALAAFFCILLNRQLRALAKTRGYPTKRINTPISVQVL